VGFFTTNPTKLSLHFSDFSMIFYEIYKIQQKALILFKIHFAAGTLERMGTLPKCPWFAFRPSESIGPLQLGPPGRPAAVRPKFRQARQCSRSGKGGATLGESLGVGLHRTWGPGLCQRAGSTAAASSRRCAPVSGEASAQLRQGAAGLAPAEARGGPGAAARLRDLVATRLGSGTHGAAVAAAVARLRSPGRREGG
jgi:hypothetical protein